MKKEDKELVIADLTEKLRTAETLIVADYRGLTMPQLDKLRGQLYESGASFSVVKNTLTRRAAEAAGADALAADGFTADGRTVADTVAQFNEETDSALAGGIQLGPAAPLTLNFEP